MVRVAFYLDNSKISNFVDFRTISQGNPGLGGTEYMISLVSSVLAERGNVEVALCTTRPACFINKLNHVICEDIEKASAWVSKNDYDYLVVGNRFISPKIVKKYSRVKYIIWAHNLVVYREIREYAMLDNVSKFLNVGKEMNDRYRDHKIFNKSTFIYNIVQVPNAISLISKSTNNSDNHNVCYVGSIIPSKGFHLLAACWKEVLKVVPDAQLFVIGSGKLYNENAKLGEYGIAEVEYEKSFINYIVDDEKKLLPSIHFMGIMGVEKYEVLRKCKVGVHSPCSSETFGLVAIEMQICGCQVTTRRCSGSIDTVYDKENLFSNPDKLGDFVLRILTAKKQPYEVPVREWILQNFSIERVIPKWELFLNDVKNYRDNENDTINNNYRYKKIKEIKRRFLPAVMLNILPPVDVLLHCYSRFRSFMDKKYIEIF